MDRALAVERLEQPHRKLNHRKVAFTINPEPADYSRSIYNFYLEKCQLPD